MILDPSWTQIHATNHGTFVEVAIHFPDHWMRMGMGPTFAVAATNAMRNAPISMGNDAPELALVEDLDVRPEGAA